MKKIKIVKIVQIILLIIFLLGSMQNVVLALQEEGAFEGDNKRVGVIDTDKYKSSDLTEDDYKTAFEMGGTIVNVLSTVGTVIAVAGIMILGIKYMMGSAEQKAEYKSGMIPYLVGCILIFCIPKIVSIIYSIVTEIKVA